jgi:2-keto-4-pentenoate hydratase
LGTLSAFPAVSPSAARSSAKATPRILAPTLAWLANHVAERGRGLIAGMVVITGSLIPTVSIAGGQRAVFTVDGLGDVVMDVA